MLGLHTAVGVTLLVATFGLPVYAVTARRASASPLVMRLVLMAVAISLLVQFGAGAAMLARGDRIVGSHYVKALLAVPLLAVPVMARRHSPLLWLASSGVLFLVVASTASIGWNT